MRGWSSLSKRSHKMEKSFKSAEGSRTDILSDVDIYTAQPQGQRSVPSSSGNCYRKYRPERVNASRSERARPACCLQMIVDSINVCVKFPNIAEIQGTVVVLRRLPRVDRCESSVSPPEFAGQPEHIMERVERGCYKFNSTID